MIEKQKFFTFVSMIFDLFDATDCQLPAIQVIEQNLTTLLMTGYNKAIRPDVQVSIDITAEIQQIISIDDKQQIMTSSSFISQTWYDYRLTWTPSSYGNITVLMLTVKNLWIPDTMILNSADTSGYFTVSDYSLASVYYDGQVYMILPALSIKTRCYMNVLNFPFDKQTCSINLTSWSQGYNRLAYTEQTDLVIDLSQYTEHPLWKLIGTDMTVFEAADRAPFEDTYNDVISIQLFLQRKPLFFMMNGIIACLILNCVTLLSYSLPFGSQIGLCMTCFITYSVYSLSFSNLFPQQSQYLMTITLYFLLSMCFTLISMAWSILCNHYVSKAELPQVLLWFSGMLPRVLFCCFPPAKKDKKEKEKDGTAGKGEAEKSEGKQTTLVTHFKQMKCISCQKLFNSCLRKKTRVETIDTTNSIIVTDLEPITMRPTSAKLDETRPKSTKPEETRPKTARPDPTPNEIPEVKEDKPKCDFCDRCETCQADFDKDKAKGKNKKDIESRCSALNYFVFFLILLFMFISNMAIWISMSS